MASTGTYRKLAAFPMADAVEYDRLMGEDEPERQGSERQGSGLVRGRGQVLHRHTLPVGRHAA